jgi:hypothetical protein
MPQFAPSAEAPQTKPALVQSNAVTSCERPVMLQLTRVLPLQVSWVVVLQTAACAAVGLVQARSSSQFEAAVTQLRTAAIRLSSDPALFDARPTRSMK